MRRIIWNEFARQDFYQNIDYLLKEWSEKEAQSFIDKVFDVLFVLEKGNVEFQKTSKKDIRRCVITRQISLFYRIKDDHLIELLRFWNNLKDIHNLNL
ncbi:MAG: type II toxin-antitoxin system RelE/ParE family toxin [Bacteroidetes bacterium]|nr:type II toxin-antitoxin system RelE/ParE family toxin [Bacteroidota bacterium]